MKKKKKLTVLLEMDFTRCLFSWKFAVVAAGICLVCLASATDIIQLAVQYRGQRELFCSTAELMKLLGFDRFKTVMIVVLSGLYSTSYCDDWNHRYFRSILCRSNLKSYAFSKIVVTVFSVVMATIIGFLLFILILLPLMGIQLSEQNVSWYGAYKMLALQNPVFFVVILGWNFGLSAAFLAVVGLWISVKQPSGLAAIGGPFLTFYFLYAISLILPPAISFELISSRPSILFYGQPFLSFLYNTGFLLALIAIAGTGFYISLRKRWKNGLI